MTLRSRTVAVLLPLGVDFSQLVQTVSAYAQLLWAAGVQQEDLSLVFKFKNPVTVKSLMKHLDALKASAIQDSVACKFVKFATLRAGELPQMKDIAGKDYKNTKKNVQIFRCKQFGLDSLLKDDQYQIHGCQFASFSLLNKHFRQQERKQKYDLAQKKYFEQHPLPQEFHEWQRKLWDIASGQPLQRIVHWVVDVKGGAGKTHMAIWLKKYHGFMYMGINPQTKKFARQFDLQRGVVFDLARDSDVSKFNYGLLEKLKDGFLFASQYQGQIKFFPHPHVFVFSNSQPLQEKLTQNRWQVIRIQ